MIGLDTKLDSDVFIMDNTTKLGDVWSFPLLGGCSADTAGLAGFKLIDTWTKYVRSNYEWQKKQEAEEAYKRSVLASRERPEDTGAGDSGGTGVIPKEDEPVGETSMEDYLEARIKHLYQKCDSLRAGLAESKSVTDSYTNQLAANANELDLLLGMKDATRKDANDVGEDLHPEVRGGGQGGSGGVGKENPTKAAPQTPRRKGKGTNA